MNQMIMNDPETGKVAWALIILEPDELVSIFNNDPIMIDLDEEGDTLPMLTIACEEDTDRLDEVLSTGNADAILAFLRHTPPKFADTLKGRRREDYERAVKDQPNRSHKLVSETVIAADQLNVAAACPSGSDAPDRISLNLSVSGSAADVCYEVTNVVQADKLIELLISLRNRLWPHGRVSS